jgi:hypothetical protein
MPIASLCKLIVSGRNQHPHRTIFNPIHMDFSGIFPAPVAMLIHPGWDAYLLKMFNLYEVPASTSSSHGDAGT